MTIVDVVAADCVFMGLCIYREGRGEPDLGKMGIGFVVQNRVAHPGWWGRNVSEVLFKKWQFSSVTDPHDPQLTTWPDETDAVWTNCLAIANSVMFGGVKDPTDGADSYYDDSIPAPSWTHSGQLTTKIGRLNFYRTTGLIKA